MTHVKYEFAFPAIDHESSLGVRYADWNSKHAAWLSTVFCK